MNNDTPSNDTPSNALLQEMHDLLSEQTRLQIHRRRSDHARVVEIDERLAEIHEKELGDFERVAEDAELECAEEPMYGQGSYGIILYAVATRDIHANELLLYHADGVYRTTGAFRELQTNGEGWYFRPNAEIPHGERFVVACIQDAPEEIENVKNGFMPDSDRARDPKRPYRTLIFGSDQKPIPPPKPD